MSKTLSLGLFEKKTVIIKLLF